MRPGLESWPETVCLRSGKTLLHTACAYLQVDAVKWLIKVYSAGLHCQLVTHSVSTEAASQHGSEGY